MRRWTTALLALAVAAVLGGGGYWAWQSGWAPLKRPPASEPVAAEPVAPAPAPTLARTLFPTEPRVAGYDLSDGTKSTEVLLPDQQRLVQTYNGVPYITWFFTADGVWRKDPRGDTVLRYLPRDLTDGLVWKHTVPTGSVWFRLTRLSGCQPAGQAPAECWQVQVLNRGELTTFTFATGMGPVSAAAENYAKPADSFTKTLKSFGPVTVTPVQRTDLLGRGLSLEKLAGAPVEPAAAADFEAALAGARK
ncbi:MAG TPA: hypothetical protein VK464_24505 [Symbiobacteriaceae bacterium]|nr:hypothetical protein [Symbiobacteriaceae bacterium]